MNNLKKLSIFVITTFVSFAFAQESENVVRIPLKTFIKPAFDLVDKNGKALSVADLKAMYDQKIDLSTINPLENKFWQNKKYEAVDQKLLSEMPDGNDGVIFDDYIGANRELGIYSLFVKPAKNQQQRYALTIGLQIHASLLKSALLRKLGIYQESPRHYQSMKMKFSSAEKMKEFVTHAFCEGGPSEEAIDCLSVDPIDRGFVSDINEKDATLVLHGLYLEKLNSEVPGLFDGLTPASENTITLYGQSRAFRALLVPFVIGDVGESVNRYAPFAVLDRTGWAYMNFTNSQYFDGITSEDDVKWMLRRMAALSDQDWNEIIDAGKFPASVKSLVKAKAMMRFKNMVEVFFSRSEQSKLIKVQIPELNITTSDGIVVDGKVTTEKIPGYPQRFSHGPRQSPFDSADLARYITIKAQSAAIDVGLSMLNAELQVQKLTSTKLIGFEKSKAGIRPLANVTGHQFGLDFNLNRIITTGTYYGSQAPVQLVDTATVSVGLGFFNFLDGLNGVKRNIGANVFYNRSFTHVTPLDSIKETKDKPLTDLFVSSKLKEMASPLNDGKLTEFLNALKIGEVFTITDTVGVGGNIGWTTGLDALVSFATITQPTVSFSADAVKVVVRQTQFTKTAQGLQVYIRDQNMRNGEAKDSTTFTYGVQFDVNYFINLLRLRAQTIKTDLYTDAFVLNYNSELMTKVEKGEVIPDEEVQKKVDKQKVFGDKMALALRALIFKSDKGPLYSNFKAQKYEVDHGIKTKEIQLKILWFRMNTLKESKLLTMRGPEKPIMVDGGMVTNDKIEIYSTRKGVLHGTDPFGFALEGADAFLKEYIKSEFAPKFSQSTQNPMQSPYGKAEWRVVRTDSELTQDRKGALPMVATIDHIWGGWSLSKQKLDKIIAKVKEGLKDTQFSNSPLVPDGALANVDKVDFFRVTSHLSLLPPAIERITELLTAPEAANDPVDKYKFAAKFFQKLSGGKQRPEDKAVYNNIMRLLGNGDEKVGIAQCKANQQANNNGEFGSNVSSGVWLYGTNYDCIEGWAQKLMSLSRKYKGLSLKEKNQWMTDVLYVLDEQIPQNYLLNALGADKFIYFVEVVGFRSGDEDADVSPAISNVLGEPQKLHPYANGLISVLADKAKINQIVLDPSPGSF